MIEYMLYVIAFFFLVIASYSDLRTREVPDMVNYGLIVVALGTRSLYSVNSFNWSFLLHGVYGFLVALLLGCLMYYTGQWGGGDSKLLMGMGAVIGFSFNISELPTLFLFIFNILLAGGVYGLGWISVLTFINREEVFTEIKRRVSDFRKLHYVLLFMSFLGIFLILFTDYLFSFALSMVFGFSLLIFYLWVWTMTVEEKVLHENVLTEDLVVGDWIAETIDLEDKIIGDDSLGVKEDDIESLIDSDIDEVLVKKGIPFVPSFLFAYLITLGFDNWINYLLF